MKQSIKIILSLCITMTFVLSSCQKVAIGQEDETETRPGTNKKVTLTVKVAHIELVPFGDMASAKKAFHAATRTTNVAEACHHLCFALYKDGKRVKYANQNAGTEDFGIVKLHVDPGKYKLLVLAHNADKNPATTDPEHIVFGKDVTDTFYEFKDIDIQNTGEIDVSLKRAVAKFQLVTTDVVPSGFSQIYCVYTGGGSTFDAVKGVGVNAGSQYKIFGLSATDINKTKTLEIYTFPRSENDSLNMLVETFNANNEIHRKLSLHVPIRKNMITRYTGSLFDESANETFHINLQSADEWETREFNF